MIKLEKGDPNNLSGNLIVYSRFINIGKVCFPNQIEEDIISSYLTSDKEKLIKKIREFETESSKIPIENLPKSYTNNKGYEKSILFYLFKIPPCSQKSDLPTSFDDNRMFSGEYFSEEECDESIYKVAEAYINELINQKNRKKYLSLSLKNIPILDSQDTNKDVKKTILTYGEIGKKKLEDYIKNNYIFPMEWNINKGSITDFKDLKRKFIYLFGYDYPIKDDLIEITKLIEKQANTDLMFNYVKKICAIKNEDYVGVQEINGKIKKLSINEL